MLARLGRLRKTQATVASAEERAIFSAFYDEIRDWAKQLGQPAPRDKPEPNSYWPGWLRNRLVMDKLLAERQFAGHHFKAGLETLDRAISTAKKHSKAHASGRTPAGERHLVEYYDKMASLLYVRRARALAAAEHESAEPDFDAAVRLNPTEPYIRIERARFYAQSGRFEEAEQALLAMRPMLPSPTARISLAMARAGLASDFVTGAGRRKQPLIALEPLDAIAQELADLERVLETTDEKLSDVRAWHGKVCVTKGDLLTELDQHRRAAEAYAESFAAYEQAGRDFLPSVLALADRLGDARVRAGDNDDAEFAYKQGRDIWSSLDKPPEEHRATASTLAAQYALARLPADGGAALDDYARAFPTGSPGPFHRITYEAEPQLAAPDVRARLWLALDRRLRAASGIERARDLVHALRELMTRDALEAEQRLFPSTDGGTPLLPFFPRIQLDIDGALIGHPRDLEQALIALGKALRQRVADHYGFVLPGISFRDGLIGRSYRLHIREREVENGRIELSYWQLALTALKRISGDSVSDQVLEALERAFAPHLWELCGRDEVWLILARNDLVSAKDQVSRVEVETERHLAMLTRQFQRLLRTGGKLAGIPKIYEQVRREWNANRPAVSNAPNSSSPGTRNPTNAAEPMGHGLALALSILGGPPEAADRLAERFTARLGTLAADLQIPPPSVRIVRNQGTDATLRLVLQVGDSFAGLSWAWKPAGWGAAWWALDAALVASRAVILASTEPSWQWRSPEGPRLPAPRRDLWGQIAIEAARLGLGIETARIAGSDAARAALRGESIGLAVELAFAAHFSDHVGVAAGAAALPQLAGLDNQMNLLRRDIYQRTGVWVPRFAVCPDSELPPEAWRLVVNRLRTAMRPMAGPQVDDIAIALTAALAEHLDAFLSIMQVELLLHRLNENRRLLVFNLLERWPLDTIVRLARQLLRARRSIRDLESLAEAMLNYDRALPAPDELELANLVNAFGDAASAWAI